MTIPEASVLFIFTLRRLALAATVLLVAVAALVGAHLLCREPARPLAPLLAEPCGAEATPPR